MSFGPGLGAAAANAFASGVQGQQQGVDRGQARERAALQNQKLQQDLQAGAYQQSLQKSPEQVEAEMQILAEQTKNMQNELNKKKVFSAFDNWGGDTELLNKELVNNKQINSALSAELPGFTQMYKVRDINLNSPADELRLQRDSKGIVTLEQIKAIQESRRQMMNMTGEELRQQGLNPDLDGFNRFVMVDGVDQEGNTVSQVVDMMSVYERTGYLGGLHDRRQKEALEAAKRAAEKAKAATGGSSRALTQVEADERDRKAAVARGDFPADGSLKEFQDQQKEATREKISTKNRLQRAKEGTYYEQEVDEDGNKLPLTYVQETMSKREGDFRASLTEVAKKNADKELSENEFTTILNRAKDLQVDTKGNPVTPDKKLLDEVNNKTRVLPGFKQLLDKIQTLDMSRSAFEKVKTGLAKLGVHGNYNEKEMAQFLNKVSFDAELQTLMAQFVKDMSGAAVTEQERAMYSKTIAGGDWGNKQAMEAALSGFINSLSQQHETNLETLHSDAPATYLIKQRDYDKQLNKFAKVEGVNQTRETPSNIQEDAKPADAAAAYKEYAMQYKDAKPGTPEYAEKLRLFKAMKESK